MSNKNKHKVVMFIAHPDDEILFGYESIYQHYVNDVNDKENFIVICFTNADNKIRSDEFYKVMKLNNTTGIMLNLIDSDKNIGNWTYSNEYIYENYLKSVFLDFNVDFESNMLISHDKNGEYGHIQHKRVYNIALYVSNLLENIKFYTFTEYRKIKNDGNKKELDIMRNKSLELYYSQRQTIKRYINFHSFF